MPAVVLVASATALAACSGGTMTAAPSPRAALSSASSLSGTAAPAGPNARAGRTTARPGPGRLSPFPGTPAYPGEGAWRPAGRLVDGRPALYTALLVPPGGTKRAGIAWMDTSLLSARLYSGSVSPGGGPYKYTAPVSRTAARTLVAAFNGGFKMADAHGGYYTQGRMVVPLVRGAASLVIYDNGSATVGAWGTDVTMTPSVASVRQNLFPLVAGGRPTARASTRTWRVWGGTCPCGTGQHGTDHQWRSGLGVTAGGALVYVAGPQLDPPQVAELLVRAGAVRGMQLDINPSWPVFASFKPAPGRRGRAVQRHPADRHLPRAGDLLRPRLRPRLHHPVRPPGHPPRLSPAPRRRTRRRRRDSYLAQIWVSPCAENHREPLGRDKNPGLEGAPRPRRRPAPDQEDHLAGRPAGSGGHGRHRRQVRAHHGGAAAPAGWGLVLLGRIVVHGDVGWLVVLGDLVVLGGLVVLGRRHRHQRRILSRPR